MMTQLEQHMNEFVAAAVDRVESKFLVHCDTDVPAEILADVLHYCRVKGMDFDNELRMARDYVDAELADWSDKIA
jgi:bifunctional ADP-heptose synthase (sugar kinase/adenylyltransferase)